MPVANELSDVSLDNVQQNIADKSEEELRLEYEWLARIAIRKTIKGMDHDTRMDGSWADSLIVYVVTGVLSEPLDYHGKVSTLYTGDLDPCINIYKIAPAHIKELISPAIADWKARAYKSPDLTLVSGPPKAGPDVWENDSAHWWG